MGKKILITSTLLFFLPLVCLKGVNFKNSKNNKYTEAKEIQFDYEESKKEILKYGQATMETDNGITEFTCADSVANYSLFQNVVSTDENLKNNMDLSFCVKSYDDVGLVELNFKMTNRLTNEVKTEGKFNGYIVDTEYGYKDVQIEILDKTVYASNLINGDFDASIFQLDPEVEKALIEMYGPKTLEPQKLGRMVLVRDDIIGGGGGPSETLGTVATIAMTVANNDEAISIAENHITAPAFNPFDLVPYLFHNYVIEHAKDHYEHNRNAETSYMPKDTDGYIVDQYLYTNYQYGVLDSTIAKSGCGIIALYNAMHESRPSESINFSALIMTYELCYADFGFGYLGVLPYDITETQRVILVAALNVIFQGIIRPLLRFIIWAIIQPILLLVVSPIIAEPICIGLEVFVDTVTDCINSLLDFYVLRVHSEGDMLRIFYGSSQVSTTTSLSDFKYMMKHRKQGIMCFWNTWDGGPVLGDGAHYIYFSKYSSGSTYKFKTYNACQDGQSDITMSNFAKLMADGYNNYNSNQFMAGFALGA